MKDLKLVAMSLTIMMFSTAISNAQQANNHVFNNDTILYDEYKFVFPIKVVKENGKTITVKNEKQLEKRYKKISENEDLNYVFPLTVEFEDGYQEIVLNIDTLYALEEYYEYEEEYIADEDFGFVFPINITTEDDEIVTINNEIELDILYENVAENTELNYNFPLTVEFEDGYQEVIKDANAFDELLYTSSCKNY